MSAGHRPAFPPKGVRVKMSIQHNHIKFTHMKASGLYEAQLKQPPYFGITRYVGQILPQGPSLDSLQADMIASLQDQIDQLATIATAWVAIITEGDLVNEASLHKNEDAAVAWLYEKMALGAIYPAINDGRTMAETLRDASRETNFTFQWFEAEMLWNGSKLEML